MDPHAEKTRPLRQNAPAETMNPQIGWDSPDVASRIHAAGLRPTAARRWALALLDAYRIHPSVEELQHLLREHDHEVSQATLYQSLQKLVDAGVVFSFIDSRGLLRFDANVSAHHHFTCTTCGAVADLALSDADERHVGKIAASQSLAFSEWRVADACLELRGVCPSCLPAG